MTRTRNRRSTMILVLGGASSGKSERALDLAGRGKPRAFVATGQALDSEMKERITRHQAARSSDWQTAEVPVNVAHWFSNHGMAFQAVVLDCLTLWLSNLHDSRVPDGSVPDKVAELLQAMRASSRRVVIVSNELGMGLVPVAAAVRKFRDLAGKVNQMVAAEADEVYFVISGQSLRLK